MSQHLITGGAAPAIMDPLKTPPHRRCGRGPGTGMEVPMQPKRTRDGTGQFVRTRQVWGPERWDDGFLDNHGRFRVYRPDCPHAYEDGYALRYHVVWWLAGHTLPGGFDLHHRNGTRSDDVLANLELKTHAEHSHHHNPRRPRMLVCEGCGREFSVNHERGKRPTRFCSQSCYHRHPRSAEHKRAQADGLRRAHREGKR